MNIAKMMLLFALAVLLLPMTMAGHFDQYLIDPAQPMNSDLVVDALEKFYKDSTLLRATCSTSQQSRNYNGILTEMRSVVSVDEFKQQIERVIQLLQKDARRDIILQQCAEFLRIQKDALRNRTHLAEQTQVMTAQSYLHYAKAEVYRLMGDYVKAMSQISDASIIRQRATGISLNELQRLHALIIIQRVSKFNHEADRLLRLRKGPDSKALAKLNPLFRDAKDPFGEWVCKRTNPEDFSERCIVDETAGKIFREFADKLAILGISSPPSTGRLPTTSTDYLSVIDEVSKINREFAKELEEQVVNNIGKGHGGQALNGADKLIGKLHDYGGWSIIGMTIYTRQQRTSDAYVRLTLETYARYFKAEMYRRMGNCNFLILAELMLDGVKNIRRQHEGLSVGKIIELDGRIVFKSLVCFHKTMESIYKLQGGEGNDELDRKRVDNGGCKSTLKLV